MARFLILIVLFVLMVGMGFVVEWGVLVGIGGGTLVGMAVDAWLNRRKA